MFITSNFILFEGAPTLISLSIFVKSSFSFNFLFEFLVSLSDLLVELCNQ